MLIRYPIAGGLLARIAICGAAEAAAREQVQVRVAERTLIVDGSARADTIALRISPVNPTRVAVGVDSDGSADLRVRRDRFDRIVVVARGGADSVRIVDRIAFTEPITIEGGAGDDTLTGGRGAETFVGGAGDDVVDGGRSADVAFLGAGADSFVWDPGDGSDVVDGQGDRDELTFNGSGAAERFDVLAAGRRVHLLRDLGTRDVTMDLGTVERIRANALGGADQFIVEDLGGTAVTELVADLASEPGGAAADEQDDDIFVRATNREDTAAVSGTRDGAVLTGLSASVRIQHTDPDDSLMVLAERGDDRVDASALPARALRLILDGGDGADDLFGGAGDDQLSSGAGNDFVDPNGGRDLALLGDNADVLHWDPGDGSDAAEGLAGNDTLEFVGSDASERFRAEDNGPRLRFTRNVADVVMDLGGFETVAANVLGGADRLTVEDLAGTEVTSVVANLSGRLGGAAGDAADDTVVVEGSSEPDNIGLNGANGTVNVTGLFTAIQLSRAESSRDGLQVRGLGGADTFDPTGLAQDTIGFTFTP